MWKNFFKDVFGLLQKFNPFPFPNTQLICVTEGADDISAQRETIFKMQRCEGVKSCLEYTPELDQFRFSLADRLEMYWLFATSGKGPLFNSCAALLMEMLMSKKTGKNQKQSTAGNQAEYFTFLYKGSEITSVQLCLGNLPKMPHNISYEIRESDQPVNVVGLVPMVESWNGNSFEHTYLSFATKNGEVYDVDLTGVQFKRYGLGSNASSALGNIFDPKTQFPYPYIIPRHQNKGYQLTVELPQPHITEMVISNIATDMFSPFEDLNGHLRQHFALCKWRAVREMLLRYPLPKPYYPILGLLAAIE